MTDPRALLEAYAEVPNMNVIPLPFTPQHCAPLAFTALHAVLDVHACAPGYDWCMHCSGGEHVEMWPCPTVRAIATALEAS